jgi:hypothetical protein
VALPSWLRECIQVTDQGQGPEEGENVLEFPRGRAEPVKNDGQSAIDLVYQAAEVVGNLQHHAREIEIRAQTLCRGALEKLRLAPGPSSTAQPPVTSLSKLRANREGIQICVEKAQ